MSDAAVLMARPQRWDVPFGPDMTEADVDRVLAIEPFRSIDSSAFPQSQSLRDILLHDSRIVRYRDGDIVVREGDYGNSAFLILAGTVHVALAAMDPAVIGRRERKTKTFFRAIAQAITNPRNVEVRDPSAYEEARSEMGVREGASGNTHIFLQDVPAVLDRLHTLPMTAGEIFGELAALGRIPRTATVFAQGEAELLEIRWQGLRDIRRRSDVVRQFVDTRYRERSLNNHLIATKLFAHLSGPELQEVANATEFETYGNFDWHQTFLSMTQENPSVRLGKEPIICEEGHYPNGLIMIRAGFARVSRKYGHGNQTVGYLGRGQHYGMDEVSRNFRARGGASQIPLQHTLRAIGYVDILRVPTPLIEKYVLPMMDAAAPARKPAQPVTRTRQATLDPDSKSGPAPAVEPGFTEFLVENRFINGTATMLIDLDRCTRCDDCVRACASAHENNPRFIRHGPTHGHYMAANACMHCQDPVCLIGCPTGAIAREPATGNVVINDNTCIGCETCANSCPYSNIRMVEIRNRVGLPILDQKTNRPIAKATKCDLCVDQWGGPACQRACPHDALKRVDMRDVATLGQWLNR